MNMDKCDSEIYKNGESVGFIAASSPEVIEAIVNDIRKDTGELIDWHYFGGRANILTTGNAELVKRSLKIKSSSDSCFKGLKH